MKQWNIDDYFEFTFQTQRSDTCVAADADALPTYRVYEENNDTVIDSGNCAKRDDSNTLGYYYVRGQCTTALGYEVGKKYEVRIAATVNSVAGAAVVGRFEIVGTGVLTGGTIYIYRDDATTTESVAGVTSNADFDSMTGQYLLEVDTSADGTFYASGHDYYAVLKGATVDGVTVNRVVGSFSIGNRSAKADLVKVDGTALDTHDSGQIPADLRAIKGDTDFAISATTLEDIATTLGTPFNTDLATDINDVSTIASAITGGIWDVDLSGHTGTGTPGEALNTGIVDGVWDATMASHVGSGTTGYALNASYILSSPGTGDTYVDHNTGGTDTLRYTTDGSTGIDDATISVYLKSAYDVGTRTLIAYTTTTSDGRWTNPLMLSAGSTYTIVFQKGTQYGPDVEEVTV